MMHSISKIVMYRKHWNPVFSYYSYDMLKWFTLITPSRLHWSRHSPLNMGHDRLNTDPSANLPCNPNETCEDYVCFCLDKLWYTHSCQSRNYGSIALVALMFLNPVPFPLKTSFSDGIRMPCRPCHVDTRSSIANYCCCSLCDDVVSGPRGSL